MPEKTYKDTQGRQLTVTFIDRPPNHQELSEMFAAKYGRQVTQPTTKPPINSGVSVFDQARKYNRPFSPPAILDQINPKTWADKARRDIASLQQPGNIRPVTPPLGTGNAPNSRPEKTTPIVGDTPGQAELRRVYSQIKKVNPDADLRMMLASVRNQNLTPEQVRQRLPAALKPIDPNLGTIRPSASAKIQNQIKKPIQTKLPIVLDSNFNPSSQQKGSATSRAIPSTATQNSILYSKQPTVSVKDLVDLTPNPEQIRSQLFPAPNRGTIRQGGGDSPPVNTMTIAGDNAARFIRQAVWSATDLPRALVEDKINHNSVAAALQFGAPLPGTGQRRGSTAGGAFARHAGNSTIPATSGFAAASATTPIAAELGLGLSGGNPLVGAVAGGIGGLLGAAGAGWLVNMAQDKVLDSLLSPEARQAQRDLVESDTTEHPVASMAGELTPNLFVAKPNFALGATATKHRLVGAGLGIGQEGYNQWQQKQFNLPRLLLAGGGGAALAGEDTQFGKWLKAPGEAFGTNFGRTYARPFGQNIGTTARNTAQEIAPFLEQYAREMSGQLNAGIPLPSRSRGFSEKLAIEQIQKRAANNEPLIPLSWDRAGYRPYAPRHTDSLIPPLFIQGGTHFTVTDTYGYKYPVASSKNVIDKFTKHIDDGATHGLISLGSDEQAVSTPQFATAWIWENVDEMHGGTKRTGPRNPNASFENLKQASKIAVGVASYERAKQVAAQKKARTGREISPEEFDNILSEKGIDFPEMNTIAEYYNWLMDMSITDRGNFLLEAAKKGNHKAYGVVPWQDVMAGYVDPRWASEKRHPTGTQVAVVGFDPRHSAAIQATGNTIGHGSFDSLLRGRGLGEGEMSEATWRHLIYDINGNMKYHPFRPGQKLITATSNHLNLLTQGVIPIQLSSQEADRFVAAFGSKNKDASKYTPQTRFRRRKIRTADTGATLADAAGTDPVRQRDLQLLTQLDDEAGRKVDTTGLSRGTGLSRFTP